MKQFFQDHSWKLCILLLTAGIILAGCFWMMPRPCRLRLGIFAGSNWDVPGSNVYEVIDHAIERFEEEHPTVEVEYISGIRKEDYSEWLSSQILKGEIPDVFMVTGRDFPTLASIGALKDLDSLFLNDLETSERLFYQSAISTGKWDHKLYAMPYESNPHFMFVNLSLLEKEGIEVPDENWQVEDLEEICQKVTRDLDGDGFPDQFGIYNYTWLNAVEAADCTPFDPQTKTPNLLDPTVQKAIACAFRLESLSKGVSVRQRDFDEGRVAFSPLSYAEYRTYKPYPWKVKRFSQFDWTIIPMPTFEEGQSGSHMDSLLMAISSRTWHSREAWDLLKELTTGEETLIDLFTLSQGLPSAKLPKIRQMAKQTEPELDFKTVETVMNRSGVLERFPGYDQLLSLVDSRIRSGYTLAEDRDIFFIDLQSELLQSIR